MAAPQTIGSPRYNAANAESTKKTANKAAAAAIVITMATDVTNGDFAAASKKAADLAKRYGDIAATRQP